MRANDFYIVSNDFLVGANGLFARANDFYVVSNDFLVGANHFVEHAGLLKADYFNLFIKL